MWAAKCSANFISTEIESLIESLVVFSSPSQHHHVKSPLMKCRQCVSHGTSTTLLTTSSKQTWQPDATVFFESVNYIRYYLLTCDKVLKMDCILSAKSSEVNDAFSSRSIANNREFTLEEIIHSMSGHLQHAHADSSQHGLEDLCEMKRNKENIDPTRVKHTDATHDGWLLKSKPECQVSPCK